MKRFDGPLTGTRKIPNPRSWQNAKTRANFLLSEVFVCFDPHQTCKQKIGNDASSTSPAEDYSLAETTKLSVGQALEKLRGTEAPKAKMARLDEKIDTLDEETQRLRTMRRRLERDQRAGSTGRDVQEANARRITKSRILGIMIGIAIVILILAWMWGLFELPTIANKG